MDKAARQAHYDKLHLEIGQKLGIKPVVVQLIRSYFYGPGKVFPEIARIVEAEAVRLYPLRKETKKFFKYKEASEFMKRASQAELQEIIRKAPYVRG